MSLRLVKFGKRPFILQTRSADGCDLRADILKPYTAARPLTTPTGTVPCGIKMFLAPDLAGPLLATGAIIPGTNLFSRPEPPKPGTGSTTGSKRTRRKRVPAVVAGNGAK